LGRATRGCGCAIAVLLAVALAGAFVGWKYVLPWWRTQPPPASGGELTIRILDVGPINGDSILISSPAGKTVLIDAGDTTKGKAVVEALKRNNIQQLDYFIATHPHPDHIGGATEVFKAVKVLNVSTTDNRRTCRRKRHLRQSRSNRLRSPRPPGARRSRLRCRSSTTITKRQ
jgi:beta-lactamase superfamily II metal-dependent hydrolase